MRTLVFQSYRKLDVPSWISRCLDTVRDWAGSCGFEYRFLGDELFEAVPVWFRARVGESRVAMSDLGRLEWAAHFLQHGAQRIIWVDADVAIFEPPSFRIAVEREFAFCAEVWLDRAPHGGLRGDRRVNNAVSVYVQGNHFLEYYRYACRQLARNHSIPLGKVSFGTGFLTAQHRLLGFPLLENVGMLTPPMIHDIGGGGSDQMHLAYAEHLSAPMYAGNFCSSFRGLDYGGLAMQDAIYDAALTRLIATRGGAVNEFLRPPPASDPRLRPGCHLG
jgi:hypothetical protein